MCHDTSHFKGQRLQASGALELAEDGEDRMDDHAGHTAFAQGHADVCCIEEVSTQQSESEQCRRTTRTNYS